VEKPKLAAGRLGLRLWGRGTGKRLLIPCLSVRLGTANASCADLLTAQCNWTWGEVPDTCISFCPRRKTLMPWIPGGHHDIARFSLASLRPRRVFSTKNAHTQHSGPIRREIIARHGGVPF